MKPHMVMPAENFGTDPGEPRAGRLLRAMHKVFSHDLPNQMVVLQSLLQLLQLEEMDRLSSDGQEYVERLTSAARTASAMVRFLKEMGRLHAYEPQLEDIVLTALARELRAELNQLCPDKTLEYQWDWDVAAVRAEYRACGQAVLGLLAERVRAADSGRCVIRAGSRATAAGVELEFRVLPQPVRPAGEQHLEVVLAREWLLAGGAELRLDPDDAGRFFILVPR